MAPSPTVHGTEAQSLSLREWHKGMGPEKEHTLSAESGRGGAVPWVTVALVEHTKGPLLETDGSTAPALVPAWARSLPSLMLGAMWYLQWNSSPTKATRDVSICSNQIPDQSVRVGGNVSPGWQSVFTQKFTRWLSHLMSQSLYWACSRQQPTFVCCLIIICIITVRFILFAIFHAFLAFYIPFWP